MIDGLNAPSAEPGRLTFSWAMLRAAGIGYAMAMVAKARAEHPKTTGLSVFDVGEDAGLALSELRSGADLVVFSGRPEVAVKLAEIAGKMGVAFEFKQ